MTEETPDAVQTAATSRDAFDSEDEGYAVETTQFDARVTATSANDWATRFHVTVWVPTLDSTVDGDVGPAVVDGWLQTLERRLVDAPSATRSKVDLSSFTVESDGETVTIDYEFEFGDAGRGLDIAKTFVEYVEGTYVEEVIPGYDYQPPVADLLSEAAQGDGERGGTPL